MTESDDLPDPKGIVMSDEFRRYIADYRQLWESYHDEDGPSQPASRETDDNSTMSTKPTTDCTDCDERMFTRRGAMKAGATAVGTAVALSAGAGTVGAVSGLNFESDLIPRPFIKGDVTIATHKGDFEALEFVNDSGDRESLKEHGVVVAPQDEEDEEDDVPYNPVTLSAAGFNAADYYAFPREETYDEDGDGDADTDVTALDETHWTVDESNTAGSMTVADTSSPADGPGLQVSTSSQTAGDTALATFDSTYLDITDGEDRKLMQFVLDVDTLESGAVVTFRVRDEDGDVREATIDPSGDAADTGVIATATGSSLVFQERMGELPQTNNGDGTFNNLEEFEIEVKEANADISLYAINLERESKWVYGVEEYTNSDDELDTQEILAPSGDYTITGLDTIQEPLASAEISGVTFKVEIQASELPDDAVEYEWKEAERYDHDYRFQGVYNPEAISQYDLSWDLTGLYDDVLMPSTRYIEMGIATGKTDQVTLEEIRDEDVSLTDRTDTYANASIDEEVELSTAISPGDHQAVYADVLYSEGERGEATVSGTGPIEGESKGPLDYLFSLPGMAISAGVGYLTIIRTGLLGKLTGGVR